MVLGIREFYLSIYCLGLENDIPAEYESIQEHGHDHHHKHLECGGNIYMYIVFFFMVTKVFVHFTNLELPQIGQTYLKFVTWLEHLIKIHLEYDEKYFLGIFTKSGIFHNLNINVLSQNNLLNVHMPSLNKKLCNSPLDKRYSR